MPDRHGPYRRIRFLLEIDGVEKAGFSRCSLPTARTDVIEYREGNEPPTPRKLGGLGRHDPLVLESGVTDDSLVLYEWRKLVEQGKLDEARRPIAVVLLEIEMVNAAGVYQVDGLLKEKLRGSGLDDHVRIVAINTKTDDPLVERIEL